MMATNRGSACPMKVSVSLLVFLTACSAFGATSTAELNNKCDSLKATGQEVYSVNRNADLGFWLRHLELSAIRSLCPREPLSP
jgi:hypothetical protein